MTKAAGASTGLGFDWLLRFAVDFAVSLSGVFAWRQWLVVRHVPESRDAARGTSARDSRQSWRFSLDSGVWGTVQRRFETVSTSGTGGHEAR